MPSTANCRFIIALSIPAGQLLKKGCCFNRYVLQLAIADSLFLLTLPFKASQDLYNSWLFPEWMCKATETILFINYYASILFLMVRA